LRLGGYSDWRLPSVDELKRISEGKRAFDESVAIYHVKKGIFLSDPSIWSSTEGTGFDFGTEDDMGGRALCVRIDNGQARTQTPQVTPAQQKGQTSPQNDADAELSSSFRCPEEYSSDEAKQAAVQEFMKAYAARFPNNNVRDMMLSRYRLLVAHSCNQTLNFMLTDVAPLSEMLRFQTQDFGPKTEEYDSDTKVWSVWFRKNGQPPARSEADVIFNFYGWPGSSPETIARAFLRPRQDLRIIGKFEAPDDVTKKPAIFVVSETLYPNETYGYVNLSKITSFGSGTYTVTFAKKLTGDSTAEIERKGVAWFLSEEGKATFDTIGHVGVDRAWEQYFAQKHR
jgi:hypothetical protein